MKMQKARIVAGILLFSGAVPISIVLAAGNQDVRILVERLKGSLETETENGHISIRSLDFSFCKWNDKDLQELTSVLRAAPTLRKLRIVKCTVNADVLDAVGATTSVESLDLAF